MKIIQQTQQFMDIFGIIEQFKCCVSLELLNYSNGKGFFARMNVATGYELVVQIEDKNAFFSRPIIDASFLRRASVVTVYALGKRRVTMYKHTK